MSKKEKFPLYLTQEMKAELERNSKSEGSSSMTGFIENAIAFYLAYQKTQNAGALLPDAVRSCIDGRLDVFENRIAAILYKLAVEMDMGLGIIADCVSLSEEYMRERRGKSVTNVKRTNGQLRFEDIVRTAGDS